MISIIMPAYNSQKHLVSSINSIFNQTYTNWELIIVNDGSNDETLNIINEIALINEKVITVTQINLGVHNARNRGIKVASGELISFIDSDDEFESTFLADLLHAITISHADCAYCGSAYQHGAKIKKHRNAFDAKDLLFNYLIQNTIFHPSCLLIKNSFLIRNNLYFETCFKIGEDIVFLSRLLCLTNPAPVPKYLYIYNYNPESVMNRHWEIEDYLNEISAWERVVEIIHSEYNGNITQPSVNQLAEGKVLYYKLKFLWKMVLTGNFDTIKNRRVNFLEYSVQTLSLLPKKYSGYRRKIIESDNLMIWKCLFWIHKLKNRA